MNPYLALNEMERSIVTSILNAHLPDGTSVHVFGSRAGGKPKPWSDLDLVLEALGPLPLSLTAKLAEAFEESELPWKVDIVDRKSVNDGFGRLIDELKVAL